MSCMVTWPATSEARKVTTLAISSGWAIFPSVIPSLYCSGKPAIVRCSASGVCHSIRCIGVSVDPGETNPNDGDSDDICDEVDSCTGDALNDQDGDGVCFLADSCPLDFGDDSDGDGICNSVDSCAFDVDNDFDSDSLCNSFDCDSSTPEPVFCAQYAAFEPKAGRCIADDRCLVCGCTCFDECQDSCPYDAENDADQDNLCANDDACPFDSDVNCAPCPPGTTWSSDTSSDECVPCEIGMFNSEVGASTCETCSAGWYQTASGASACEPCAQMTACVDCGGRDCSGFERCAHACFFAFFNIVGGVLICVRG